MEKNEIKVLADLVVSRARVDRTEPDPKNLQVGWVTDLLFVAIDAFVARQENDPAAYAEIGREILVQVGYLPEVAVLAKLAVFRGERLLPMGEEREKSLFWQMDVIQKAIISLPAGARKSRCQSLLKFHSSVFLNDHGYFDMAADAQKQAAMEAERSGDLPGAAIYWFVQNVYLLKQALCEGKAQNELEALFLDLEKKLAKLIQALRGSVLEVQWGEGNGPLHMIEVCVWLNRDHQKWDDWVTTACEAAEKLGGDAWASNAKFIRTIDMAKRQDPQAKMALMQVAVGQGSNEIKAIALLVLARRTMELGDKAGAKAFVDQMPEVGVQHIRAIAERMMSAPEK